MTDTQLAGTVSTAAGRDGGWQDAESFAWGSAVATYNYGPCGLVRAAPAAPVDPATPSRSACGRAAASRADRRHAAASPPIDRTIGSTGARIRKPGLLPATRA